MIIERHFEGNDSLETVLINFIEQFDITLGSQYSGERVNAIPSNEEGVETK
jgi:hypothetical protein